MVSLFDSVVAVINAEKTKHGYPKNRVLITHENKVIKYLCGNIIIVRSDGDKFTSILEEDIPKIEAMMPAFYLTYIEDDKVLHMLKSELPISGEEYYGWEKYLEKLEERELMLRRKLYGEEE